MDMKNWCLLILQDYTCTLLQKKITEKVYYNEDKQAVQNKTYFGIFLGEGKKEHRVSIPLKYQLIYAISKELRGLLLEITTLW
jgi:hypothetical protein